METREDDKKLKYFQTWPAMLFHFGQLDSLTGSSPFPRSYLLIDFLPSSTQMTSARLPDFFGAPTRHLRLLYTAELNTTSFSFLTWTSFIYGPTSIVNHDLASSKKGQEEEEEEIRSSIDWIG